MNDESDGHQVAQKEFKFSIFCRDGNKMLVLKLGSQIFNPKETYNLLCNKMLTKYQNPIISPTKAYHDAERGVICHTDL